jgi:hypothetical protein
VELAARVDAKKQRLGPEEALALLRDVDTLIATRGKRVVTVDLRKARPQRAELLVLLLGPSGALRAPTRRRGRTLVVGFDEAIYARLLG